MIAITAACQGCGACLLTCPERAIRPAGGARPLAVLATRCTGCAECVEICPADAIQFMRARSAARYAAGETAAGETAAGETAAGETAAGETKGEKQ